MYIIKEVNMKRSCLLEEKKEGRRRNKRVSKEQKPPWSSHHLAEWEAQVHITLLWNDNHTLLWGWHTTGRIIFAGQPRSFSLIKLLYLKSIWQNCHQHTNRGADSPNLRGLVWGVVCISSCALHINSTDHLRNLEKKTLFPWGALRWFY